MKLVAAGSLQTGRNLRPHTRVGSIRSDVLLPRGAARSIQMGLPLIVSRIHRGTRDSVTTRRHPQFPSEPPCSSSLSRAFFHLVEKAMPTARDGLFLFQPSQAPGTEGPKFRCNPRDGLFRSQPSQGRRT